jgi:hypothetical protein
MPLPLSMLLGTPVHFSCRWSRVAPVLHRLQLFLHTESQKCSCTFLRVVSCYFKRRAEPSSTACLPRFGQFPFVTVKKSAFNDSDFQILNVLQVVLDERTNHQLRLDNHNARVVCPCSISASCDTMTSTAEPNNGLMTFLDEKVPPPGLFTYSSSCDVDNNFEAFTTELSRSPRNLVDANVKISCTEYLDLMKSEVDRLLDKLNDDIMAFKSYRWAHGIPADDSCSVVCHCGKLVEIGEGFNSFKLLLAVVFQHIREMLRLVNTSVHDLQWEHELQLEVTDIITGDCIRGLQDELGRKLYEQSSIISSLRKNWQETVSQCASIREDLIAISNMLLPPEEEHESIGNRSDRWKFSFFGKKTCDGHSPSSGEVNMSSATQKSISPSEVISEKSDFRHLKGMARQDMLNYFRSEISKLKRLHEIDLQERTEELFKFKREKWSLALKYDVEFEPLRKKFPEVISRFDKIMRNVMAAPTICTSESSRLKSRIDSLYSENQHLRGLLAKKTKEVQELSCQISDANRKISLQYSLEKQLLRQVVNIEGEYEDFHVESTIRDEIYQNVTSHLVDNHKNILEDTVHNFHAKMNALEATLLEKDNALYLVNEENQKLKEKISMLEKEHFIRNNQQDPELMKKESEEMILRDIEMESHISPQRSWEISDQDVHYQELIKLNQTLEIASTTLKEVEANKLDYSYILDNREQDRQLDCILASIMDLSKEFVEIEHKTSEEGNVKRYVGLSLSIGSI